MTDEDFFERVRASGYERKALAALIAATRGPDSTPDMYGTMSNLVASWDAVRELLEAYVSFEFSRIGFPYSRPVPRIVPLRYVQVGKVADKSGNNIPDVTEKVSQTVDDFVSVEVTAPRWHNVEQYRGVYMVWVKKAIRELATWASNEHLHATLRHIVRQVHNETAADVFSSLSSHYKKTGDVMDNGALYTRYRDLFYRLNALDSDWFDIEPFQRTSYRQPLQFGFVKGAFTKDDPLPYSEFTALIPKGLPEVFGKDARK